MDFDTVSMQLKRASRRAQSHSVGSKERAAGEVLFIVDPNRGQGVCDEFLDVYYFLDKGPAGSCLNIMSINTC